MNLWHGLHVINQRSNTNKSSRKNSPQMCDLSWSTSQTWTKRTFWPWTTSLKSSPWSTRWLHSNPHQVQASVTTACWPMGLVSLTPTTLSSTTTTLSMLPTPWMLLMIQNYSLRSTQGSTSRLTVPLQQTRYSPLPLPSSRICSRQEGSGICRRQSEVLTQCCSKYLPMQIKLLYSTNLNSSCIENCTIILTTHK